jgi:hypothetical protein
MRKILIPVFALVVLTGCARWDEASEREACAKSNPGDQAKADECYVKNKLAYDRGVSWAIWNHGAR